MIRKPLLLFSFIILSCIGFAQESTITDRVNIKLGRSKTPQFYDWGDDIKLRNLRLEANYGPHRFVEVGGYVGFRRTNNYILPTENHQGTSLIQQHKQSNVLFLGTLSNLHLIPFLTQNENIRFEIYLSARVGLIHIFASDEYAFSGILMDLGLSGGLAYYITNAWGVYAEYGLSKKAYRNSMEMEMALWYGLTFKF